MMRKIGYLDSNVDITIRSSVKKELGIPRNRKVISFVRETRNNLDPDCIYEVEQGTCYFLTRRSHQGYIYGTLIQIERH